MIVSMMITRMHICWKHVTASNCEQTEYGYGYWNGLAVHTDMTYRVSDLCGVTSNDSKFD